MESGAVVILTGSDEGKNIFNRVVKENNYWCWNVNARNVLGMAARLMGWNGKRTPKYYEFIDKLSELANTYWCFDENYFIGKVRKFYADPKANLLVLHRVPEYLVERLVNEYDAFVIDIGKNNSLSLTCDKHIDLTGNYEETILGVLRIITG